MGVTSEDRPMLSETAHIERVIRVCPEGAEFGAIELDDSQVILYE